MNVCSPEEEAKCRLEIGEEDDEQAETFFKNACGRCEKKKSRQIGVWTNHLLWLRRLCKAGYPFGKNDLPLETWGDLGLIEEMIEANRPRMF